MYAQWGYELQRGISDQAYLAFNLDLCMPLMDVQNLGKIDVSMRRNLPVMEATALRYGFAVQKILRGPSEVVPIQSEDRNISLHQTS
ncbi:hypothetical protein D3C85_1638010 [compost metagenome]